MLIGVVGAPNAGKSTFFSAATMIDVPIAAYPFTTVKPNQGTSFVRTKCVCREFNVTCNPVNSKCVNGERLIPITLLDVAGLVRGSHLGKGMGNQFLSDLMMAKALVQVLDASGSTDEEGKIIEPGHKDPAEDVEFLDYEIVQWLKGILAKNWEKIVKMPGNSAEAIAQQLSGLGMSLEDVKLTIKKQGFSENLRNWNDADILKFVEEVKRTSKPMMIAANKMDVHGAKENYEKLKGKFVGKQIVPCCAEAELALRKAEKAGLIEYLLGDSDFKEKGELPEKQKHALEFIRKNVLEVFGGTGVQQAINKTAFELLNLIVVYPVQDQHKLASGQGNVLPDAFLLPKGSTAIGLAGTIHSDFVQRFVSAVDCRSGKKIGKETELHNNDVIKIQLSH